MEPQIQYTTARDGTRIAYWALGEGPPLLLSPPMIWSNALLEWRQPEVRRWYEALASSMQVIRYDPRGNGLSDRRVATHPDAWGSDLEAVADKLSLHQFSLMSFFGHGPVALAYAARHPERITRLILWCVVPRATDFKSEPLMPLSTLREQDWQAFTESLAHTLMGWQEGEMAHRWAQFIRDSIDQSYFAAADAAYTNLDATDLLCDVRCPTLVLHRSGFPWIDLAAVQAMVARMPDARLMLFEGSEPVPMLGDVDNVLKTLGEFLQRPFPAIGSATSTEMRAVLFTDIVGSTAMTVRLGDRGAQDEVRRHDAATRAALDLHGGTEVKHTGDGIMASFKSASAAVECALAIRRRLAGAEFQIRIGINAGEPIMQGNDLFGTTVQIARRICDEAADGEILASNVVRELTAGKGYVFADRGEVLLRGFDQPVKVVSVDPP
jgi:class 3 adenylate cyclase